MADDAYMFPVSFAQRRLWFIDQLVPGNAFYNLHAAVPLKGPVDAAVLARALNALVERHEALRTTFVVAGDEPMQRVAESLHIELPAEDLAALALDARARRVAEAAQDEAQRPFDLAAGPLLRARLLRRAPGDQVLLVTLHHIVSDGWSMNVFWQELTALYNAFLLGRPSPLPELPIQYADYAVWQNEWLQGQALQAQLDYWRERLQGAPALDLPTDRPRPPVASYRGAQQPVRLRAPLAAQLRALGQRQGTTLFMTLLAAFATLLARSSGQTDVVVGVPTAGRTRAELEGLIGFFVNTLVMRCDLAGDPPFDALMQRVRQVALGAYANQDLPFEKLVEALQPDRDLSRNPLFQVTFQLLSTAPAAVAAAAGEPQAQRGSAAFDLSLNLWDGGGEVAGHFEYAADLFDATTVERMARRFETLLEDIVAAPQQPIGRLALMDAAERRRVLVDWNRTAADVPAATIDALFAAQADRAPERLALAAGGRQLGYGALERQAGAIARALRSRGVGRGDAVALCLPRGIELVAAMLGTMKAGAAYVPLDACAPDERLHLLLDRCEARALLVDAAAARRLAGRREPMLDSAALAFSEADAAPPPSAGTGPDDIACVIFTSGSTGVPKGVEVRHGGLANLVHWHLRAFGLHADDRTSQVAGPAFDAFGWEVWPSLCAGASVHFADDELRAAPRELLAWLARERISVGFVPTPVAEPMLAERMPAGLALRALLTGGDRLHRAPAPGLPFVVHNNYGPTECTVVATSMPLAPQGDDLPPPIGRAIANTRLYVLDAQHRPVPVGVWGELHIGGAGVARGYRGDAAQTSERFVDWHGERVYASGDVVRWRDDGTLEFRGRSDRQVKVRGHRIELGEIESALRRDERVREAAVVLRDDGRLAAYVVAQDGAQTDDEAVFAKGVREALARRVPEHELPAAVVVLPALPLTANGKVDLRSLPAPAAAAGGSDEPRGPVEGTLAALMCEVLGRARVGRHDHFFADLGGHSLLATQLVSRVRGAFDVELPLRDFFGAPTVAALAEAVEEALVAQIDALSNEDAARLAAQA
ncbi:amino acid adenylation domain-containing protein [Aquincola sp. MAHUQ-54]|uniref:Amino acid adenylation domain-containing protein n=1 Tax=Aquincola agrisoli TaxID=3119538 RepID=A0AAW9PYQ3_9BURK